MEIGDRAAWERMRNDLWPESPEDHAREIGSCFDGPRSEPLELLVAVADDGRAVGMIELSIRTHALGCTTDRIAFIEGWYVVPQVRRTGVGFDEAGTVRCFRKAL